MAASPLAQIPPELIFISRKLNWPANGLKVLPHAFEVNTAASPRTSPGSFPKNIGDNVVWALAKGKSERSGSFTFR